MENYSPDTGLPPAKARTTGQRLRVRSIAFDAPWDWLGAGWRDMWAAPHVSVTYGVIFAVLSVGLTMGLIWFGLQSLVLALGGGFMLIAPLFAVGLYETSRRLGKGESVTFADGIRAASGAAGRLAFFGAVLAFAFAVWLQLALLLFMLFMNGRGIPPANEFVPMLLFTTHGVSLLVVGTVVGGILAALVFTISAISVPLLLTRKVDAVTAMATSIEAVVLNPKPMALWACLIAAFMALGIATLFVGLVIAFPLIGHATWHAYRALVPDIP